MRSGRVDWGGASPLAGGSPRQAPASPRQQEQAASRATIDKKANKKAKSQAKQSNKKKARLGKQQQMRGEALGL